MTSRWPRAVTGRAVTGRAVTGRAVTGRWPRAVTGRWPAGQCTGPSLQCQTKARASQSNTERGSVAAGSVPAFLLLGVPGDPAVVPSG